MPLDDLQESDKGFGERVVLKQQWSVIRDVFVFLRSKNNNKIFSSGMNYNWDEATDSNNSQTNYDVSCCCCILALQWVIGSIHKCNTKVT